MRQLYDLDRWQNIGHEEGESFPAWFRTETGQYVTVAARVRHVPNAALYVIMYPDASDDDPNAWTDGVGHSLGVFAEYQEFQFWLPEGAGVRLQTHSLGEVPAEPVSVDVYTAQGDNWVMPPVEGESFARVMERAPRNEEYEQMLAVTMRNVERRMAQERSETARVLAEMDRQHRAELAEARAVGASDEGAGKPRKTVAPPATDGGSSDEAADENEGGGGGDDDNAVA